MPTDSTVELPLEAKKLAQTLSWLGLIPFLALGITAALGGPQWAELPLIAYGALILSFMAGTLWYALITGQRRVEHPKAWLIGVNALVLVGWPAMAWPAPWACLWLAVLFAAHWMMDRPWQAHTGPAWYRRMRWMISACVITSLTLGGLVGLGLEPLGLFRNG